MYIYIYIYIYHNRSQAPRFVRALGAALADGEVSNPVGEAQRARTTTFRSL